MKICPTCKRTYSDELLSFCLDDGTPLQTAGATPPGSFDPQATVSFQPPRDTTPPSQQSMPAPTVYSSPSPVSQPQYPPQQWSPMPQQAAPQKKRSAAPWIIAGLIILFLLVLGGVGIVALLVYMGSKVDNQNTNNRNANIFTTRGNANPNRNTNTTTSVTEPTTDLNDDFSVQKWGVSDDNLGKFWYENDELHAHAVAGRYVVEYGPKETPYYTKNATVKMTVRAVYGDSPKFGYGMIVHGQLKDAQLEDYSFVIKSGADPQYAIMLHRAGKEELLEKWTASSAIRSGSLPNQLEVRIIEGILSFYINGQYVNTITDTAGFKTGRVGIYTSDTAEVAFDDLSIVH